MERDRKLGFAWILLALSLAAHVTDEALTGFLSVYNPTVAAMRAKWGLFPMPQFDFSVWLVSLIVGIIVLLLLSPLMFRGARWMRIPAYIIAGIMFANGIAHITATVLGKTVESVHFARPAPGFYSSPLLLASSIYLLAALRTKRRLPA